jgi:hypothetical protein
VAGFELSHVTVDGAWCQKVAQAQIPFELVVVQAAVPRGALSNPLYLARKVQDAFEDGVEERLLAESIAGGEQFPLRPVVDREREHPFQAIDAGGSEFLVGVHDDLGVGTGPEPVAPGQELFA